MQKHSINDYFEMDLNIIGTKLPCTYFFLYTRYSPIEINNNDAEPVSGVEF